jgi:hypothetical protein
MNSIQKYGLPFAIYEKLIFYTINNYIIVLEELKIKR